MKRGGEREEGPTGGRPRASPGGGFLVLEGDMGGRRRESGGEYGVVEEGRRKEESRRGRGEEEVGTGDESSKDRY